MEKKPILIWVLVIFWLVIGISYISLMYSQIQNYLDYTAMYSDVSPMLKSSIMDNYLLFSLIINLLLYFYILIFSIINSYFTLFKKEKWLIAIIFTSSLLYTIYYGLVLLGSILLRDYNHDLSQYTFYLPIFITMILAPIQLFILTRPLVKKYYSVK